jgi:glycosyltransferase 2 family protein
MAGGIRDIGRSRFFYSSFGISLFLLLGQILSYWLVMQAYGLKLSFWHGAAVFLVVHIGTIIPGAPSNIGTYQFFTVVGLTLFGIDKTLATSFSIVVFFILTIPLWVVGMVVFSRLGLSLKKVQTEITALAKG